MHVTVDTCTVCVGGALRYDNFVTKKGLEAIVLSELSFSGCT